MECELVEQALSVFAVYEQHSPGQEVAGEIIEAGWDCNPDRAGNWTQGGGDVLSLGVPHIWELPL